MKHALVIYFNGTESCSCATTTFDGIIEEGFDILAKNPIGEIMLYDRYDEVLGVILPKGSHYMFWGDCIAESEERSGITAKYKKIDGKWTQVERNGVPVEDIERTDRIMSEPLPETEEIPLEISA